MFSKRKSNNINGWIIIDKPAGITSTGVVSKIKRAFSAKKVGHAGTLDPDATGVLPIALGEATKTIPHICLLYTSPSPRDGLLSRMPSSA